MKSFIEIFVGTWIEKFVGIRNGIEILNGKASLRTLAICGFAWSSLALASPVPSAGNAEKALTPEQHQVQVQKLADTYFARTYLKSLAKKKLADSSFSGHESRVDGREECRPEGRQSCIDAACARLPSYACDDISEIQQIGRACAGNFDGECVTAMCQRLPSYGCDDMSEVSTVAQSCRGNYGGDCVNAVCSHMASYACDDISELQQAASMCQHVDGSCINDVCSRMASYQCDDMQELRQVAQACGGTR